VNISRIQLVLSWGNSEVSKGSVTDEVHFKLVQRSNSNFDWRESCLCGQTSDSEPSMVEHSCCSSARARLL